MQLQKSRFHFIGVGGIGMCGLAELLHNMGAKVSGSDISDNPQTERLRSLGLKIFKGHMADNISDADVVVYSSAINDLNPEIKAARAQRIPLIARAEALAEIMRLKKGLAVAGTHGKTTTTSMAASIFLEAKVNPTIVIGGRFDLIKSTALLGDGDWLVAEADESDGSFHKLSPEIAIITNIDSDHMDYYKSYENLEKSFLSFAQRIPFYGICIVCGDDQRVRDLFSSFPKRIVFYGFNEANDYVIRGEKGSYQLIDKEMPQEKIVGSFQVKVPGKHNALNATAAIISGLKAGFSFETCKNGLLKFEGVDRRFHYKGEGSGVLVYDDYGHHPTEVKATLQAFREKFPEKRIVIYFQPHRYSRTETCWSEFTQCFGQSDLLFIGDIYAAGEAAIPGITAERLAKEIRHDNCEYLAKSANLPQQIFSYCRRGDVFVTLGAGDDWKLGMEVLELLKKV